MRNAKQLVKDIQYVESALGRMESDDKFRIACENVLKEAYRSVLLPRNVDAVDDAAVLKILEDMAAPKGTVLFKNDLGQEVGKIVNIKGD